MVFAFLISASCRLVIYVDEICANKTGTLTIATRTFSFDIVTDAKTSQSKNNEGNDKR